MIDPAHAGLVNVPKAFGFDLRWVWYSAILKTYSTGTEPMGEIAKALKYDQADRSNLTVGSHYLHVVS